jgi:pimeloyl-ACP methyl ester carboxylesterase
LVYEFLREVVGTPAILIGNSMGGMIVVLAAVANPDAVAGLVLIDPALPARRGGHPDALVSLGVLGYALPGVGRALVTASRRWAGATRSVESILKLSCVDPARVPADVVDRLTALAEQRMSYPGTESDYLEALHSTLRALVAPARYEATMHAIRQPVLLLHGEKDRLVSVEAARRAANPRWAFETFPDVGHVPQLEAPDQTATAVLRWLAGPGATAAGEATRPQLPRPSSAGDARERRPGVGPAVHSNCGAWEGGEYLAETWTDGSTRRSRRPPPRQLATVRD